MSNLERRPLLLKYWRRLFHSRVHVALGTQRARQDPHGGGGARPRRGDRPVGVRGDPASPDAGQLPAARCRRRLDLPRVRRRLPRTALLRGEPPAQLLSRASATSAGSSNSWARTSTPPTCSPGRASRTPPTRCCPPTRARRSRRRRTGSSCASAQSAANSDNLVKAAILRIRASRIAPAAQTMPTRLRGRGRHRPPQPAPRRRPRADRGRARRVDALPDAAARQGRPGRPPDGGPRPRGLAAGLPRPRAGGLHARPRRVPLLRRQAADQAAAAQPAPRPHLDAPPRRARRSSARSASRTPTAATSRACCSRRRRGPRSRSSRASAPSSSPRSRTSASSRPRRSSTSPSRRWWTNCSTASAVTATSPSPSCATRSRATSSSCPT